MTSIKDKGFSIYPTLDPPANTADGRVVPTLDRPQLGRTPLKTKPHETRTSGVAAELDSGGSPEFLAAVRASEESLGFKASTPLQMQRMALLAGHNCKWARIPNEPGHLPYMWHICPACYPDA